MNRYNVAITSGPKHNVRKNYHAEAWTEAEAVVQARAQLVVAPDAEISVTLEWEDPAGPPSPTGKKAKESPGGHGP
jgi:hypothetical protein